jgi:hypothetical protein
MPPLRVTHRPRRAYGPAHVRRYPVWDPRQQVPAQDRSPDGARNEMPGCPLATLGGSTYRHTVFRQVLAEHRPDTSEAERSG